MMTEAPDDLSGSADMSEANKILLLRQRLQLMRLQKMQKLKQQLLMLDKNTLGTLETQFKA